MRHTILRYPDINFKFIITWKIYYVLAWGEARVKEIETIYKHTGFAGGSDGRVCQPKQKMQGTLVWSLGQEEPLEEEMATLPVFLPRKFHAQRSLVDYSPWGRRAGQNRACACRHKHILGLFSILLAGSPSRVHQQGLKPQAILARHHFSLSWASITFILSYVNLLAHG